MGSSKHLLLSFILCFGNSVNCMPNTLNLPEGSHCVDNRYKSSDHICRKLNDCPSALQDLTRRLKPVVCSLNAVEVSNPIICCRKVETYSAAEKCLEYSSFIYQGQYTLSLANNDKYKARSCVAVQPLISNGIKAKSKEFPHMALIGYHETMDSVNKLWLCGGSLISLKWVLSAAHCDQLNKDSKASTPIIPRFARLGILNFEEPSDNNQQDFEITERVVYPDYIWTLRYNDIALFRLDRDVTPTLFVRPLCLHTEKSIPSSKVVATGWGRKALGEPQSPDLLKASLKIMSATQCNSTYFKNNKKTIPKGVLDESMVCAGVDGTGQDTCNGDSGGPIQIPHPNKNFTCLYSQVGITSFGQLICGTDNTASVYTRVSAYIPWIELIVWPKI